MAKLLGQHTGTALPGWVGIIVGQAQTEGICLL